MPSKDGDQTYKVDDTVEKVKRKVSEESVQRANRDQNEKRHHDIALIAHKSEIDLCGKKDVRNARTVERRYGDQIEYREADVQNGKLL